MKFKRCDSDSKSKCNCECEFTGEHKCCRCVGLTAAVAVVSDAAIAVTVVAVPAAEVGNGVAMIQRGYAALDAVGWNFRILVGSDGTHE